MVAIDGSEWGAIVAGADNSSLVDNDGSNCFFEAGCSFFKH